MDMRETDGVIQSDSNPTAIDNRAYRSRRNGVPGRDAILRDRARSATYQSCDENARFD